MRIVVSGTHASGKSTLISDFASRHRDFAVLADPFDSLDERWDSPTASPFAAQLRISADRLVPRDSAGHVIAERGPLDFLAYLLAIDGMGGSLSPELDQRARAITREALERVDLLVVLPLTAADQIVVGEDEHPVLREAMNDVLLDLLDDSDLIGPGTSIVEIAGRPPERLLALESAVSGLPS